MKPDQEHQEDVQTTLLHVVIALVQTAPDKHEIAMIIIIMILTNVISPLHPKLHGMDCTPGPASSLFTTSVQSVAGCTMS